MSDRNISRAWKGHTTTAIRLAAATITTAAGSEALQFFGSCTLRALARVGMGGENKIGIDPSQIFLRPESKNAPHSRSKNRESTSMESKMIRKAETIALTVLLVAVHSTLAQGQQPPLSIVTIDVQEVVFYESDIFDPAKFATNPNVTPATPARPFRVDVALGDIVAVNGQPAKGTYVSRPVSIQLTPAYNPGQGKAIADSTHTSLRSHTFEILKSDGTPVGTMMSFGLDGGQPPPGAPSNPVATRGNYTIFGGTGAFLGARGELVQQQVVSVRAASMAEDPANRRINGGGTLRFFLHVTPLTTPQIAATSGGPAVTHSRDFTLVTASKPAAAGEILSLFETGLGPTNPGVDPGQPFPSSPAAAVNSPVDVTFNGKPAEVLGAVGFPGAVDGYQVNFRVPPDAAKGVATIQVSSAWIVGMPGSIALQ